MRLPPPSYSPFRLVLTWAWLAAAAWLPAQTPPAPADAILDETRALSDETRLQLAEELKQFRQDLKYEGWLRTCSFMPTGVTVRRQAQLTRRSWSGTQPAVLMLYDRATGSSAISFAPVLWERYPATDLVETIQEIRRILADPKLTLDERLTVATRSWIDRMRTMESVRLKQSLWLQRSEKKFGMAVPALLAGGAVIAALFGFVSRRRSANADRRFLLPEVHVGARFGAAFGGGVTAEVKANAAAH